MRKLIVSDVADDIDPAERLTDILASAKRKAAASDLPSPSIEDVDRFIESIRDERIAKGMVR